MRRAVLTLSGTVAGLAALFSFKTHVPGATPVAEASTPAGLSVSAPASPAVSAAGSASAAPSAKKTAKASSTPTAPTTRPATPAKTTPAATHPAKAPSSSAPPSTAPAKPSGNFTGPNENTQYGPVQVQLTVANGKITAANDVQQPEDSIGANAVSQLNSEVLTAQSANIQAVSGATYTSNGYIASLQQAVDQAGL
ncbi:MAG TPA: FMN-binding protein [Trebonia sp.]|jgi:uncharacterized protein with FMN-binding domain